jgi:hypothetical protein
MEEGRVVGVEPLGYEPPSDCELVNDGNATASPGPMSEGCSHCRNPRSVEWDKKEQVRA